MASKKNQSQIKMSDYSLKKRIKALQASKHLSFSPYYLVFVVIWIFCGFIYDDTLYIAEQHSYFAFDNLLMEHIKSISPLLVLGRFFLLSFKEPIVGGFFMSIMLTFVGYLFNYTCGFKKHFSIIGILLPFIYLTIIVSLGLDLFFHYDPGFIFAFPIIGLFIFITTSIARWFIIKGKDSIIKNFTNSTSANWSGNAASIVLFAGLVFMSCNLYEDTNITCKMQRQMQKEDWTLMVETANSAKQPTRIICAYRALALIQSDQLLNNIFDIYYQFPDKKVTDKNGEENSGYYYYSPDCDLFCGLVQPSYHMNMEYIVAGGLNLYRLKQMFLYALVTKQIPLAEKYLSLIEKMPFEKDFIEKYSPMLFNTELIVQDPTLSKIIEMIPIDDCFEQDLHEPIFLSYYTLLPKTKSWRAYHATLAANLYSKNLNGFMERAIGLDGHNIPSICEEAGIVYELSKRELNPENFRPFILNGVKQMLNDANQIEGSNLDKGKALKDKYMNNYAFYYFYENIFENSENDSKKNKEGLVN